MAVTIGGAMDESLLTQVIAIQNDVRAAFGWSYEDDVQSAKELQKLFQSATPFGVAHWSKEARQHTLHRIQGELRKAQHVVLVGAAAAKSDLMQNWPDGTLYIAADGAVGAFPESISPLCVVTDLDGAEHLDRAASDGATLVVHAHGDNQHRWERLMPQWAEHGQPQLVLTHQTNESYDGMHNPGGFTDGDRAACLLHWLGIDLNKVELIGFTTGRVGPWSGSTDEEQKMRKLNWMRTILECLNDGFSRFIGVK
ncbi:hypothetical protein N9M68_04230 [Candidatus Poseidonia alphae]|nr:hypothetical protein [Candidatus Poseidonia alphae]